MRVSAVKTYLMNPGVGKNWLFVKVETDEGLAGWGEAYTQADRDRSIEVHVTQLARYLVGRNPFDVRHFTFMAYTDFANKRGAMDLFSAISAIEQALWDIVGKAANQPVYNLLGGRFRSSVRVYANGWGGGGTLDELRTRAKAVVARGFSALKFDPFPGPWRAYIGRREEDAAVERVAAVRDAVGPEVDILVEVHRRLAPAQAIRVAAQLEALRPFWFEEPVSARDLPGLALAKQSIRLPVVTGEELYTKNEFRDLFAQRAADIINPDVCVCGGILELREIAAMADAHHIAVSPHNYNSTAVGLAATVHAAAGMPNFLITEYFVSFEEIAQAICPNALRPVSGMIALPEGPGLGVDLDEDALAAYAYREFANRRLPTPQDEM